MVYVDKPTWVSHDGQPIFSIDVHPDRSRFATAGQDHQVKLWALKPVIDPDAESDEAQPQLLSTLGGHLGAVNCVRWSGDGALLASGSDDHLVMIWRQAAAGEAAGSVPFGSKAPPSTERWRCILTLSGHAGDVIDLSWSPVGHRLASVSLDNMVRVWEVSGALTGGAQLGGAQQLIAALPGHQGMVKGVAWDPIGRYVASQGDDKAVLLWETREWTEAAKIEEPFTRTSQKTLFRRLRWSPDGQFLCAPHAYKKPAHIAAVLRRPTGTDTSAWKEEVDFVGHKSPVVVAAFSPHIFTRTLSPTADSPTGGGRKGCAYCVCALGGQDSIVSIWLTCKPKAACVVRDLFSEDVLDLSWASDGRTLLCCSMDGTVASIRLEPSEIGYPLSEDEQAARLAHLYGENYMSGGAHIVAAAQLPQSAEMLQLEGTSPAKPLGRRHAEAAGCPPLQPRPAPKPSWVRGSSTGPSSPQPTRGGAGGAPATPPPSRSSGAAIANGTSPAGSGANQLSPEQVIRLQRETKTKDGRRRITPVAIDPAVSETQAPANSQSLVAQLPPAMPIDPAGSATADAPASLPPSASATIPSAPLVSRGCSVKDALSAAAPCSFMPPPVASHATSFHMPAAPTIAGTELANRKADVVDGGAPKRQRVVPRRVGDLPAAASAAPDSRVMAAAAAAPGAVADGPTPVAYARSRLLESASVPPAGRVSLCVPASAHHSGTLGSGKDGPCNGFGNVGRGSLGAGGGGSCVLEAIACGDESVAGTTLADTSYGRGGTLCCWLDGQIQWSAALTSPAVLLAAGAGWYAVACEDGTTLVLTPAGRRALPAMHAVVAVAALHAEDDSLLLVGTEGEVRVWRGLPSTARCSLSVSAAPVLQPRAPADARASLLRVSLTGDGSPVLALEGRSFIWRAEFNAWLALDDVGFTGSEYASSLSHPIHSGSAVDVAMRLAAMPTERQKMLTTAHIEQRMATAEALGAGDQYAEWTRLYARHLAQAPADVARVRELCDDLLGPIEAVLSARQRAQTQIGETCGAIAGGPADDRREALGWASHVGEVSKVKLLRETILPTLATNRELQRILAEYLEMLQALRP